MDELETELLSIRPEAEKTTLGRHTVYRYRNTTPAHTFESALELTPGAAAVE